MRGGQKRLVLLSLSLFLFTGLVSTSSTERARKAN